MLFGSARKVALGTVCKRLGASERQQAAALRAVSPWEKRTGPATKALGKQIEAMARRFAQTMHRASSAEELQEMTYVVLSAYAHLARQAGDEVYAPLFEQAAWEVRVEMDAARLEQVKALL